MSYHLVKHLAKYGIESIPEAVKGTGEAEGGKPGAVKVVLSGAAIILLLAIFAGEAGTKATFRRNYGMNDYSLTSLFLCGLALIGAAVFSFTLVSSRTGISSFLGSDNNHLFTGFGFVGLAAHVLINGLGNWSKHLPDNLEGRSILKDSSNEPFVVLTIGALFCLINLFGGAVIIFCGLSTWLNRLVETAFKHKSPYTNVRELNEVGHKKSFNEIR